LVFNTSTAHRNFFSLGGSSLTAIRMAAKIQDVFGVSIPIGQFLDTPHARFIDTGYRGSAAGASRLSPMLPRAVADPAAQHEPFRLTPIQQAYWVGRSGSVPLGNVATHHYVEVEIEDSTSTV